MADLALVMPMAGRGSRFTRAGGRLPKPMMELGGRPFFWWAAQSVLRGVAVRELIFVVLAEHVATFGIDEAVLRLYPEARIVVVPDVTSGAAETAALGVDALTGEGPVAVNDCDHGFAVTGLADLVGALGRMAARGALLGFRSDNPAYSYVRFADDGSGRVVGTVEKRRAGPYAIAGCYLFADKATFATAMAAYRRDCTYPELFVSGLFNAMCAEGGTVTFRPLDRHIPFGTPEELSVVTPAALAALHAA